MALTKKRVTAKQLAANRRNSQQSTGPKTALGKRNASQNSLQHGLFAKSLEGSFRQLGEDPEDFHALVQSLRETFQPEDHFEEMLIEDLAVLRWRLHRLRRAEWGIQVRQKRSFEFDRECRVNSKGGPVSNEAELYILATYGLSGLENSPEKFAKIRENLGNLRMSVRMAGFQKSHRGFLRFVYGERPGLAGAALLATYTSFEKQPKKRDLGREKETREEFLGQLDAEITSFENLAKLHEKNETDAAGPMADAQLLPRAEDLDNILRYETTIERHFERKLQQLVSWRRARAEVVPPDMRTS